MVKKEQKTKAKGKITATKENDEVANMIQPNKRGNI